MHLLRLLSGSLPGGCHRRGAELRILDRDPRGALLRQGEALGQRRPLGGRDCPQSRNRRTLSVIPMNDDFTKLFKTMMEQGQEMVRAFNPSLENMSVKGFENFIPTMTKDMMEMWFGRTFNREGLDAKTRLLVTIAALTVLGAHAEAQLKLTIRHALEAGATKREIAEVIWQMSMRFLRKPRRRTHERCGYCLLLLRRGDGGGGPHGHRIAQPRAFGSVADPDLPVVGGAVRPAGGGVCGHAADHRLRRRGGGAVPLRRDDAGRRFRGTEGRDGAHHAAGAVDRGHHHPAIRHGLCGLDPGRRRAGSASGSGTGHRGCAEHQGTGSADL
ncbi:UNVERIFIED_CONTAM: hypothetical protein NCL1_02748 [Trichonephila clavipes]